MLHSQALWDICKIVWKCNDKVATIHYCSVEFTVRGNGLMTMLVMQERKSYISIKETEKIVKCEWCKYQSPVVVQSFAQNREGSMLRNWALTLVEYKHCWKKYFQEKKRNFEFSEHLPGIRVLR